MGTPVTIGSPPEARGCPRSCGSGTSYDGPASIGSMTTRRSDRWWLTPLGTGVFLGSLTVYAAWAGFQTAHFAVGSYISPLYSPCVAADCGVHANLVLIGAWWHFSPALLVMGIPVGVRATCYYYRKVYYRSFWLSPPACAVGEPRQRYSGESRFPLLLQNVHRYFWAGSILVAVMLTADSVRAFELPGGVGIGVGTVLIGLTAAAFWGYVLSCHAFRHLVGGGLTAFSGHPIRHLGWRLASRLNAHHGLFAWFSLPLVIITDGYIRLLSIGVLADLHVLVFH
jgi:hypothetical protein